MNIPESLRSDNTLLCQEKIGTDYDTGKTYPVLFTYTICERVVPVKSQFTGGEVISSILLIVVFAVFFYDKIKRKYNED